MSGSSVILNQWDEGYFDIDSIDSLIEALMEEEEEEEDN